DPNGRGVFASAAEFVMSDVDVHTVSSFSGATHIAGSTFRCTTGHVVSPKISTVRPHGRSIPGYKRDNCGAQCRFLRVPTGIGQHLDRRAPRPSDPAPQSDRLARRQAMPRAR